MLKIWDRRTGRQTQDIIEQSSRDQTKIFCSGVEDGGGAGGILAQMYVRLAIFLAVIAAKLIKSAKMGIQTNVLCNASIQQT